jgi:sugar phosphate isomerase/epimerase
MKTYFLLVFCCLLGLVSCTHVNPEEVSTQGSGKTNMSGPAWPFFAFCMDTHDARKRTLAQQATMLEDLGYAGCGHLWLDDVETRTKTLSDVGLRLFQVYVQVDLAKTQPLDEMRIAEVLPLLKPHRTQLVLLMTGGKPSDSKLDDQAVGVLKRLADMARPHEVTIALYPHVNNWLETCGDAVRVAQKVNCRAEVGVMFNLCHWMKGDPNRDLRAVIRQAMSWLMAVSLSGSDMPEQVRRGRGNWIQPLDQGTYDIRDLLGILRDYGFSGPIGLQCWGISGDARAHLKQSMAAWKRLTMNWESSCGWRPQLLICGNSL